MQGGDPKAPVDLLNFDYDDVLHLYRGWRRAEDLLKERDRELHSLRTRAQQLEDVHIKFRNQIKALESVKELTISLQTQLSVMQQENYQLSLENRELLETNERMSNLLNEKCRSLDFQNNSMTSTQLEFDVMKRNYEEASASKSALESALLQEQKRRITIESKLRDMENTSEDFQKKNTLLESQYNTVKQRLSQCDNELAQASEQLKSLSSEILRTEFSKERLTSLESSNSMLKTSISRLIRLLEHYPTTKALSTHWQDSNGVAFIGQGHSDDHLDGTRNYNTKQRGKQPRGKTPNSMTSRNQSVLTSSDQKSTDRSIWDSSTAIDVSIAELSQWKKTHGEDVYPMTPNMNDELQVWVPRDAYELGTHFMASRLPHAPPSVIKDFLRNMNKIWLKREKRKLRRVKTNYEDIIKDLKRQLAQSRPYSGVMADQKIRRLSSIVQEQRHRNIFENVKTAKGRMNYSYSDNEGDDDDEDFDLDSDIDVSRGRGKGKGGGRDGYGRSGTMSDSGLEKRRSIRSTCASCNTRSNNNINNTACTCTCSKINKKQNSTKFMARKSAEKLLSASLNSLESLGRHLEESSIRDGHDFRDSHGDRDRDSYRAPVSRPSAEFLRGALWLGRNMAMLVEETSESVDMYKSKYVREIASVSQDPDLHRCNHRMYLLAGSGIAEVSALTQKCKTSARDILKGTASLEPGDTKAFEGLLKVLPIDGALGSSMQAKTTNSANKSPSYMRPLGGSPIAFPSVSWGDGTMSSDI